MFRTTVSKTDKEVRNKERVVIFIGNPFLYRQIEKPDYSTSNTML